MQRLDLKAPKPRFKYYQIWVLVLSASIPFLQLGITYYLSVNVVAFLLLSTATTLRIRREEASVLLAGGMLFAVKTIEIAFVEGSVHDVLFVVREWVCFAVLILAIGRISKLQPNIDISWYALLFIMLAAATTLLQEIMIRGGVFLSFPTDWFVHNQRTLVGVNDALIHGTRLRPVGFYGEPSYMAFVVISAYTVVLMLERSWKRILAALVLTSLCIGLLNTIAGIAALVILTSIFIFRQTLIASSQSKKALAVTLGFAVLTVATFLFAPGDVTHRMINLALAGLDSDQSAQARIGLPLLILERTLDAGNWFGHSVSGAYRAAAGLGALSIDNALLALLINYGVLGLLIVWLLLAYLRDSLLCAYLLLTMNFNGQLFSFDKVVVLALVLGFTARNKLVSRRQARIALDSPSTRVATDKA